MEGFSVGMWMDMVAGEVSAWCPPGVGQPLPQRAAKTGTAQAGELRGTCMGV